MIFSNKSRTGVAFNPSESEKFANDKELAKRMIDNYVDNPINTDRLKRLDEGLELHAGRWSAIEELQNGMEITIDKETFTIGSTKVRHYDKIGRITRGLEGSFIAAPFVAIFKDISSKSKSMADKLKMEAIKENLYEKYITPKIDLITKQELIKSGATEMFELPPEQQMQIQAQVTDRVQKESPEEILSILEKIKTPDEQVCQLLFGYTASQEKLKQKYDTGSVFAIANGEEYYRPYMLNNMPKLEVLIPRGVNFGGSPHIDHVEDGTFATYKQYLSVEDVIARFGLGFLKGDVANLDQYYNTQTQTGYTGNSFSNKKDMAMVELIGTDPILRETNFLTRDGQQMLNAVYARMGNQINHFKIQHNFATWKWTTRLKAVTRLYKGKPMTFIVSGHYTKNPETDIKIKSFLAPQVWNGDRLGNSVYQNLEIKKYQYDSIQNPFTPKLDIYGGMYNSLMGTTENYSLIDNAKIWNFRYDMIMARKEEVEATDHGKIALFTLNAKPKGVTWEDWINGILTTKIGLVANNADIQFNPDEKKVIQSIDMSRLADAAGIIQELQHTESELFKSMYTSEAKIGDIGQYATNQNSALQIEGADRQLMPFYNKHRTITTNVSYAMLKLSLIAYRDNDIVKDAVLDDFLKTHYEINMKNEDIGQYAIVLLDTMNEMASVKKMTDLALAFVQNGVIGLKELSRLFSATTMAEAQDIIDEAEDKRIKQQQADMQNKKEMEAQNAKYQQELVKLKQDFDAMQKDLDRKVKLTVSEMGSHMMSNAQDIDENDVNDSLTKAYAELASKQKIHNDEMAFKYAELEVKEKQVKATKAAKTSK